MDRRKFKLPSAEMVDAALWIVFSIFVLVVIGFQQYGYYFNAG